MHRAGNQGHPTIPVRQQNQDTCPALLSEALCKCFPHRVVLPLGPTNPERDCLPDVLPLSNKDTPTEHSGLPGAIVVVGTDRIWRAPAAGMLSLLVSLTIGW